MLTETNKRYSRTTWWITCVAVLIFAIPAIAQPEPPPSDDAEMDSDGFGPPRRMQGRGPREHRRGGPDRMIWERLSDEEREAIRQMVAESFPERLEEFEAATSDDQPRGRFMRVVAELMRMRELKENDPEMFEVQAAELRLDFRLRRLAREYRFSDDEAERERLIGEIRKAAAERFDLQGVRMEIEIDQLRAKLDHLQKVIEKRFADRDAAIERMVERITGNDRFDGPPRRGGVRERLHRLRERRGIDESKPHAVPEPESDPRP